MQNHLKKSTAKKLPSVTIIYHSYFHSPITGLTICSVFTFSDDICSWETEGKEKVNAYICSMGYNIPILECTAYQHYFSY